MWLDIVLQINEENIKEIKTDIYWLKNFKFVEVIFKDEENINYLFQYSKGDKGQGLNMKRLKK
jgi:hypothetical protein